MSAGALVYGILAFVFLLVSFGAIAGVAMGIFALMCKLFRNVEVAMAASAAIIMATAVIGITAYEFDDSGGCDGKRANPIICGDWHGF